MKSGERILVRYVGDPVMHERLLLWPLGGSAWIMCTPDFDVYEEDPLDTDYIDRVRHQYFRERDRENFRRNFRTYARSCEIGEHFDGWRRRLAEGDEGK